MKIVVIGATGGVGQRLVPLLVEAGHEVHGLHRKPEQARGLQRAGATPRAGDLMEMAPGDFSALVAGADAVVFSAGAGGAGIEQATKIDGDGAEKVVRAMEREGVSRLVLVSVFPEAGRDREGSETFEHYMACKKRADVAVAASSLDWVLVRPGTLEDGDGDGRVRAGRVVPYGTVARGNVARTIAGVLDRPWITREAIELTDGDVPLGEALDALRRRA
jgi:uncharacterized protein YbjT (DUF2867 family)